RSAAERVSRATPMSVHCGLRCGRFVATALAALLLSACAPPPAQRPLLVPAPDSPIAVAGAPGDVALRAVNGDRQLDLGVAGGKSKCVAVLLGQGGGRFRPAPGSPLAVPDHPTEMVLCDFNGDGKLDLALASHGSYAVTLLLGDGKGGLAPAPQSPVVMKKGK